MKLCQLDDTGGRGSLWKKTSIRKSLKRKDVFMSDERRDTVKITTLKLRHCGLSKVQIIRKHPHGLCECGRPETVQHVLPLCVKYNKRNEKLFKALSDSLSVSSLSTLLGLNEDHRLTERRVIQFCVLQRKCLFSSDGFGLWFSTIFIYY